VQFDWRKWLYQRRASTAISYRAWPISRVNNLNPWGSQGTICERMIIQQVGAGTSMTKCNWRKQSLSIPRRRICQKWVLKEEETINSSWPNVCVSFLFSRFHVFHSMYQVGWTRTGLVTW
jgi:hypothetical protein